jgi:TolB-like protein
VLPFENLGGEAGREYLADGLTEEVTALLGQLGVERLDVIGRTSVMAYKRTTKSSDRSRIGCGLSCRELHQRPRREVPHHFQADSRP